MARQQSAEEVFFARWGTTARESREDYADSEVERMRAQGARLLTEAITAPTAEQQDAALRAMARMGVTQVQLRLVPNADPPKTDPNGHLLPEDKQGKVLRAKIGQHSPDPRVDSKERQQAFTGSGREARAMRGQPLYLWREITSEPVYLPIGEAMVILRQWGKGVRTTRYLNPATKTGDKWLVEEVPQGGASIGDAGNAQRANRAGR